MGKKGRRLTLKLNLDPNREQKEQIDNNIRVMRYVYNADIYFIKKYYLKNGEHSSGQDSSNNNVYCQLPLSVLPILPNRENRC